MKLWTISVCLLAVCGIAHAQRLGPDRLQLGGH
jgi:hypothetical protein